MGKQSQRKKARKEARERENERETRDESAKPQKLAPLGPALERFSLRAEEVLGSRWFLPAVLVLAACLRLGHVWALRSTPWLENLQLDHRVYDQWAQRIAAGDWIGDEIFFLDPLYPYFLALLYKVFGRDLLRLRLGREIELVDRLDDAGGHVAGVGADALEETVGQRIGGSQVERLFCAH